MKESLFCHTYTEVLQVLRKRLREPAPSRAQILAGPRQVGKTTMLDEIAGEWSALHYVLQKTQDHEDKVSN